MAQQTSGRLVILSGPSCAGKSPLDRALARFHPDLHRALRKVILFNSRAPRPGEEDGVDYHFRTRQQIEKLRSEQRYVVMDVRGDLQALDVQQLLTDLGESDVFYEANPFVGHVLLTHPELEAIRRISAFVSPLSLEEIRDLADPARHVDLPAFVTDAMRRKLLRRTRRQKGILSLKDLENVERRAGSAYRELQTAHEFDCVLPNHDGEDSENWSDFYYPLGEARRTLKGFVALLQGKTPSVAETWEPDTLPPAD